MLLVLETLSLDKQYFNLYDSFVKKRIKRRGEERRGGEGRGEGGMWSGGDYSM